MRKQKIITCHKGLINDNKWSGRIHFKRTSYLLRLCVLLIKGKDSQQGCGGKEGVGIAPRGGARNFRRGLTLPTRGLKYGFLGTISTEILRKSSFSPSDGASMLRRGWAISTKLFKVGIYSSYIQLI